MRILRTTLMFLSICSLSACVTPPPRLNVNDQQAIADKIVVKRDDFKKKTTYEGPDASGDYYDSLFIRGWKDYSSEKVDYQIYVIDGYTGREWRFYNEAYDSNGNKLETIKIHSEVKWCGGSGCTYFEHLGINIAKEYLDKNKDNGIRLKISGKAGEEIFYITPAYIKATLARFK